MTYTVRIVLRDCNARYLGVRGGKLALCEMGESHYKSISAARRAAKKYLGDGKALGKPFADILDDDNEERSIEI